MGKNYCNKCIFYNEVYGCEKTKKFNYGINDYTYGRCSELNPDGECQNYVYEKYKTIKNIIYNITGIVLTVGGISLMLLLATLIGSVIFAFIEYFFFDYGSLSVCFQHEFSYYH